MDSQVYPKALTAMMKAQINLEAGNVKALLIDADMDPYDAEHEFLEDINPDAIVATSGNLSGKTFGVVNYGVFDADDLTLPGVSGLSTEGIIIFIDTGYTATSRVLAWVTGTVVPDGGNLQIQFHPSGIFQI